jgi:dihydrofolate reductase
MLRGYIASSADGFIADAGGGVGFLDACDGVNVGYDAFYAGIDNLIMGRTTFDQVRGFDLPWPYQGKPCHIMTSTDIDAAPDGVSRWTGSLADYAAAMRGQTAWVVGGARLQADFIAAGLLDRLTLFIVPTLLGRGLPLFPHGDGAVPLVLSETQTYDRGLVRLDYRLAVRAPDV